MGRLRSMLIIENPKAGEDFVMQAGDLAPFVPTPTSPKPSSLISQERLIKSVTNWITQAASVH